MTLPGWTKKSISLDTPHSIWQNAAPPGSNDVAVPVSRSLLHAALHGIIVLVSLRLLKWAWSKARPQPSDTTTHLEANSTKVDVSNKHREHGEWTPQIFHYPEIDPCLFELKDVKPIPYRPFKWGEYHVTMGIRSMPWSEWIELDCTYADYQRIRNFRLRTRGRNAVRVLPSREDGCVRVSGGADAAKELVYELAEYLSRRYPLCFRVTRDSSCSPSLGGVPLSWDGNIPIRTVEVIETGAKFDLGVLNTLEGVEMGEQAMKIVIGLVQEDISVMMEGSDGKYYFQAGSICTPGFWRMDDKIGMSLDEIHLSGNVPQFREKLDMSMARFFRRMPLDKPVVRNNYFIQVVKPSEMVDADEEDREELGWSATTNGPEDAFEHGHGHSGDPGGHVRVDTVRLRSERQTLRRLPRTGAIVFGIRTYLTKLEEVAREEGGVGRRLASAIRSWPDDVGRYKGRGMYDEVVVGYLEDASRMRGHRAASYGA